jgi:hypothetical protein
MGQLMPIIERDEWRKQYFADVDCPEGIVISTEDQDSFDLYPDYRWVYNKIKICETQQIRCAPHDVPPVDYPVFSKPITNLRGMGIDSHKLNNGNDYHNYCKSGHFWMEYLTGDHISSDVAIIEGEIVWQAHVKGMAAPEGTFDYWQILSEPIPQLEATYAEWLSQYLKNYTGMINIESIGGKIIEIHLRVIDQWPDLYGEGWLKAVVNLYEKAIWSYNSARPKQSAYSVVLFGSHGRQYDHPPQNLIDRLKTNENISSIQITFNNSLKASQHAMPPGGFRLAVINAYNLVEGRKIMKQLADFFAVPYSV